MFCRGIGTGLLLAAEQGGDCFVDRVASSRAVDPHILDEPRHGIRLPAFEMPLVELELRDERRMVAQLAHHGVIPDGAIEHLLARLKVAEDMVELVGMAIFPQKCPLLALDFMTFEPAPIRATPKELR